MFGKLNNDVICFYNEILNVLLITNLIYAFKVYPDLQLKEVLIRNLLQPFLVISGFECFVDNGSHYLSFHLASIPLFVNLKGFGFPKILNRFV